MVRNKMKTAKNDSGSTKTATRTGRIFIAGTAIALTFAAAWFYAGSTPNVTTSAANAWAIAESNGANQTGFDHGVPLNDNQTMPETEPSDKARLRESYGNLPLSFEANQGQTARPVKFLSRGSGYSFFLTPDEAVLRLRNDSGQQKELKDDPTKALPNTGSTVLRMKLAGANPSPQVAGLEELPGKTNYYIGKDPAKWRTNIPNYARVKYEAVYPGVDMVYYGNQRQLEYDFIVAPGADPNAIKLGVKGAENVSIDTGGDLLLAAKSSVARLQRPVIYQELNGSRQEIEGEYVLVDKTNVAFRIGEYDHSLPLVIDPVLVYSTFLGGSGDDGVYEVAVDGSGNAFATGYTASANFPTTAGAYDTGYNGGAYDAFVTKLNATGTAAFFSTYFGGSDADVGDGIAVDSSGNVYVGGLAKSINFPTTAGAFDTTCGSCGSGGPGNPPGDAFVAKFGGMTGGLIASTLYGASDYEQAYSLALDSAGNVYIGGGWAKAFSYSIPTPNGFQSAPLSYYDEFLAKFSPDLSTLLYATVIGGSDDDYAVQGIVSSSPGVVSVTGVTRSTNFPTTAGAFSSVCGSTFHAFAMTINTNLPGAPSLVYSTCLGGSVSASGSGIALDGGNIWVTGGTSSSDFPTTPGAYDTVLNGPSDVFLTKLNPSAFGSAQLVYSTFIGGSGDENGAKVVLDATGDVYVAGSTSSADFPTVSSPQGFGGVTDAFITRLNPVTNTLVYSTFLGSCLDDNAYGLALDPAGNAYVGGRTVSSGFPVTAGAYQTMFGGVGVGNGDGFVTKIAPGVMPTYDACPAVPPTPLPTPSPLTTPTPSGTSPSLSGEVAAYPPPPGTIVVTPTGPACTTYSFTVTTTAAGPYQGTFTATGTFTLEPMVPDPMTPNINHRVVGWTETFTIDQPVSLLPPQPIAHVAAHDHRPAAARACRPSDGHSQLQRLGTGRRGGVRRGHVAIVPRAGI